MQSRAFGESGHNSIKIFIIPAGGSNLTQACRNDIPKKSGELDIHLESDWKAFGCLKIICSSLLQSFDSITPSIWSVRLYDSTSFCSFMTIFSPVIILQL